MKKYLLLLTIFILTLQVVNSQTYVSGGIYSNTTWTLANSPYVVVDTVTVFPGVTLTIQPGVVVKLNDIINIEIRGTLNATGTITDSIFFTSTSSSVSPNSLEATGLRINVGLGGITNIKYCNFSYLDFGINFVNWSVSGNSSYIDNSRFSYNKHGLVGETHYWTYIYVNKCKFINNDIGIGYSWYYEIRDCIFIGNKIGVTGEVVNSHNSIFCGNTTGIDTDKGTYDSLTVTNNTVGFRLQGSNGITISNSSVFKNDTGIVIGPQYISINIHQNNICKNYLFNVVHTDSYNFDMTNNCWCDTNAIAISAKIYDGYDNVSLGLIDFTPFINCDSTAIRDSSYCLENSSGIHHSIFYSNPSINIYPNPFNQYAILEFENSKKENHTLTIYDSQGKLVQKISNITTNRLEIERQYLSSGLFFFQLQNDKQIIAIGKFIIE